MGFSSLILGEEEVPGAGEGDVGGVEEGSKEGRHLPVGEAGYAAAHAGYEKVQLGMRGNVAAKVFNVGGYGVNAAVHRRDGIGLAVMAGALTPHRTEFLMGDARGASAVTSGEVAAEDEDFVGLQGGDEVGGEHVGPGEGFSE